MAVLGWGDWPDILLLLQPSLKVTNTVFADCICLFIHSQIWISYNLEQYHKHNRESCHSNADPEEMNRDLFLVIISQISCKINPILELIFRSLSVKCRIFSFSSLTKLLKFYVEFLMLSFFKTQHFSLCLLFLTIFFTLLLLSQIWITTCVWIVLGFGIIFSLFFIYLFIFMQSETKCFNSKNLTIKNVIH